MLIVKEIENRKGVLNKQNRLFSLTTKATQSGGFMLPSVFTVDLIESLQHLPVF
jgi:hypothetical protein